MTASVYLYKDTPKMKLEIRFLVILNAEESQVLGQNEHFTYTPP